MDKPTIPWLQYLKPNDRITTSTPYIEGKYYDLFEEKHFVTGDKRIGDIRYYVYDPTKHGFSAEGTYPVLVMLHGAGASLHGITAINWAAAEYFASTDYQQRMGGAYVIVPLANETEGKEHTEMTWMTPVETTDALEDYDLSMLKKLEKEYGDHLIQLLGRNSVYTESLIRLISAEKATFAAAGKTFIFGTSAGGYCAWRLILSMPVDAAVIMAGAYLPSPTELKQLEDQGLPLWICHGIHDELVPFSFCVEPNLEQLKRMKNVSLYLPEFVRMPNGCVYSNPAGVEMGQHCINNSVQCDLMFDDGTPMDPAHPHGVTGWIREMARN